MPDCVKVLVNECNTLGETLMRHTLHQYATFSRDDGKGGRLARAGGGASSSHGAAAPPPPVKKVRCAEPKDDHNCSPEASLSLSGA